MKDSDNIKSYTLSPEEVESLLQSRFGERIQPVDSAMVAHQRQKQQQRQAAIDMYKAKFNKAKNNGEALTD